MIGPYKEFRVMRNFFPREDRRKMEELDCPGSIPWALIEGHRKQAEKNHCGQTLERLQERGGLSPAELALALQDRPLFPDIDKISTEEAVGVIKAFVAILENPDLMPPFHDGCKCVFNPETGDFETPGGTNTLVPCVCRSGVCSSGDMKSKGDKAIDREELRRRVTVPVFNFVGDPYKVLVLTVRGANYGLSFGNWNFLVYDVCRSIHHGQVTTVLMSWCRIRWRGVWTPIVKRVVGHRSCVEKGLTEEKMNRKHTNEALDWLEGWAKCFQGESENWERAVNIIRQIRRYLNQNQPSAERDPMRKLAAALVKANRGHVTFSRRWMLANPDESEVLLALCSLLEASGQ